MKAVLLDPTIPLAIPEPAQATFTYVSASNPTRTIVNDSNNNWLATFTNNARTVTLRGQQRTFTELSQGLQDTFTRTRTSGWGPAEKGGVWYTTGGDNADFSVNSGFAHMLCTTEGLTRRTSVSNNIQDIDATVKVKTDKTAAGDEQIAGMMFAYQSTDNHYLARLHFVPAIITDTFDRTTAGGWGSSNAEYTWSTSGGTSLDYSTNGTEGVHSVGAVNSSRRTLLSSAQATDFDITVKVKTSVLAAGASQIAAVLGRYQDSNNHYLFRARFTSNSTREVFASIQKNQAGITTVLGSEVTTAYTHSANTYYRIRAQASGATLRMRVWPDGSVEPSSWDVSLTDSTFSTTGSIGVRSILLTGNTDTLPVLFTYDDFQATLDGAVGDRVQVSLQIRVAGNYTTIGSTVTLSGVTHGADEWFHLRVQHATSGNIKVRAWKDGTTEPSTWQLTVSDITYISGRVGMRSIVNTGTINLPVNFSYDDVSVSASWPQNPTIQHNVWVRILPTPFTGTVDENWLRAALIDTSPDALAIAMQYLSGAPAVTDPAQSNLQIMGDSQYGPLQADGTRQEGADFNDYLGIAWSYGSSTDSPEAGQFRCLDCSGYVRMVYGYRMGIRMRLTTIDGVSLPRISSAIANGGPGILIAQSNTQITDLTGIGVGDAVAFDADNSNPAEEEGQIDHIGIYMGTDTNGLHRFISARKTGNGPTFADVGGPSVIAGGTNLYSRTLRTIRRF